MKKIASLVLLSAAVGVTFILASHSAPAQAAVTVYMSANSENVNQYTPPGPATNFAILPFGTNPAGLAFDTFGNLFVAGGGDVTKILPNGSHSVFATLPTGAGGTGMAIDAGNNLYVADNPLHEISKITPGGAVSVFATLSGSFGPTGLTFDTLGNLYACTGNTVREITPGGAVSTYATLTGHVNTYGLAFDSFGYLYVADLTSAALLKVAPGGGSFSNFGSLSSGPQGLAFDHSGLLYAALSTEDKISTVATDGTASTFGTSLNGPRYLAFKSGPIVATGVVSLATPIPGGTGNFTSLPSATGYSSGGQVAFYGQGSPGQAGIYRGVPGNPVKVADLTTAIPSGTGNFTSFVPGNPVTPAIDGSNVAFFGAGSGGQQGIYVGVPGNPVRIADTATAIPGGSGNFTSFTPTGIPPNPAISGNNVAFFGAGSGGQQGIYAGDFSVPGNPVRIADTATLIPGGTGTFTSIPSEPCLSGDNVAFLGTGSGGQQGVYRAALGGSTVMVADLNTAIPGGTGNFTSFVPGNPVVPAIDGNTVAFFGAGSGGQQGIYAGVPGNPVRIADTATAIPGGMGDFTSFGQVSLSDTDVAFLGLGASGQEGIYDLTGGSLIKVVDLNDILNGRSITGLSLANTAVAGDPIAFEATFADGSQGIFTYPVSVVPEPSTALLSGFGALAVVCARLRQRRRRRSKCRT